MNAPKKKVCVSMLLPSSDFQNRGGWWWKGGRRRQLLASKGMDRRQTRRILREVELRRDVRAGAIFSLFLYTGCRVGDLVALELHDLMLSERSGSVVFRLGKGNKQKSVPLPLPARRALQAYLDTRPAVQSARLFIGERGPLTEKGVRRIC